MAYVIKSMYSVEYAELFFQIHIKRMLPRPLSTKMTASEEIHSNY